MLTHGVLSGALSRLSVGVFARPRDFPQFSTCAWLVFGLAPDPGAAQLRPEPTALTYRDISRDLPAIERNGLSLFDKRQSSNVKRRRLNPLRR